MVSSAKWGGIVQVEPTLQIIQSEEVILLYVPRTSVLLHFSKGMKQLLGFFKNPSSIASYINLVAGNDKVERKYLQKMFSSLINQKILIRSIAERARREAPLSDNYERPIKLKREVFRQENIIFLQTNAS